MYNGEKKKRRHPDVIREDVFSSFFPGEEAESVKPFGPGRYLVAWREGGAERRCVLSRFRGELFSSPAAPAQNLAGVISWIRAAAARGGGDPDREAPALFYAQSGEPFCTAQAGGAWWCAAHTPGERASRHIRLEGAALQAGRALGRFFLRLAEYPVETLNRPRVALHHFPARRGELLRALESDRLGRATLARCELDFALARAGGGGLLAALARPPACARRARRAPHLAHPAG